MAPRASRIAVMVASVPVETSRSFSIIGVPSATSRPIDELGQFGLARGGGTEGQAAGCRVPHRVDDARVRVAEQGRSPRGDEIDVLAAGDIGHRGALRGDDGERGAADGAEGAHRGVDPAGDHGAGAGRGIRVRGTFETALMRGSTARAASIAQ